MAVEAYSPPLPLRCRWQHYKYRRGYYYYYYY